MPSEIKRWTITEAIEEAKKMNIHLSKPTVIKMCRKQGIGYQPTGRAGKWVINSDQFIKIIKGE